MFSLLMEVLHWGKSLNKGAAGKVWYCSCLSRNKYANRVWLAFYSVGVSLFRQQMVLCAHAKETQTKCHFTSKCFSLLDVKYADDTSAKRIKQSVFYCTHRNTRLPFMPLSSNCCSSGIKFLYNRLCKIDLLHNGSRFERRLHLQFATANS